MKLKIFTVYDDALGAYLQPFFMLTTAMAIRAFAEMANNPNDMFCKYAHQYTLFELGEYNQSNSEWILHPTPHALGKAVEFRLNTQAELFNAPALKAAE